jgi:hypothetical protein
MDARTVGGGYGRKLISRHVPGYMMNRVDMFNMEGK